MDHLSVFYKKILSCQLSMISQKSQPTPTPPPPPPINNGGFALCVSYILSRTSWFRLFLIEIDLLDFPFKVENCQRQQYEQIICSGDKWVEYSTGGRRSALVFRVRELLKFGYPHINLQIIFSTSRSVVKSIYIITQPSCFIYSN